MKIHYYETNLGKFYKIPSEIDLYGRSGPSEINYLNNYIFNGLEWREFFIHNYYGLADSLTVHKKVPSHIIVVGYKLDNPDLASDKIPAYIHGTDTKWDWSAEKWVGPNAEIMSLYTKDTATTEASIEKVEVEFIKIRDIEIDNFTKPESLKVKIKNPDFWTSNDKNEPVEIKSVVNYDELTRMLTPTFLLKDKPCFITSDVTYAIIRNWVKDHIDGSVARVTSDYDFCFTVSKVVKILPVKFQKQKYTPKGNSYKPPKYESVLKTSETKKFFDMTPASKKYSGYPIIEGFRGDNLQDLIDNVKGYLDILMSAINTPLEECEHCKGSGYIETIKVDMNKRV